MYRNFLSVPENRKYTFRFINLDKLGGYGKIKVIESQTYEDPMILAMNTHESRKESEQYLARRYRVDDTQLAEWYENYRPLGA